MIPYTSLSCDGTMADAAAKMLTAAPDHVLRRLEDLDAHMIGNEPVDVPTAHVLHDGLYARTSRLPPDHGLTGALVKIATLLLVTGTVEMLNGDAWQRLEGYNVLCGLPGRKQLIVTRSSVVLTMIFPTAARTVAEAEEEFTDDFERLLSRRQNANAVRVTPALTGREAELIDTEEICPEQFRSER